MLAYNPVEFNSLDTFAKTFNTPAKQNHLIQENFLNKAPVCRIAIAMITTSAITTSHTENPFWYQPFDLRQIRILGRSQPIVDFDAAFKCHQYITTMKAMFFQYIIPSFSIVTSKDHYLLVFDLTSMQDAIEDCHYTEFIGEPVTRELKFIFLNALLNSLYWENE